MSVLVTMLACGALDGIPEEPSASCQHQAWYPDADADGVGDAGGMYVGCAPPAGYVSVPPDPMDTGADSDSDTP